MTLAPPQVRIRSGSTRESDPQTAVERLDSTLKFAEADAVILFVSSKYDLPQLARAIRERIAAPLLCCTTAGEMSSELGYFENGISGATLRGCRARVVCQRNPAPATGTVQLAPDDVEFAMSPNELEPNAVGLFVTDGLCRQEEEIIQRMQNELPAVPIVGGSAGDACAFKDTYVYRDGEFQRDCFALLLLRGSFTAIPFHTHHFVPSGTRVVATCVDPMRRRVLELDGMPARTRLARHLNIAEAAVTVEQLFSTTLMVRYGESYFVRSVQSIDPDGGLTLYCAIRNGEVLHVGKVTQSLVDHTALYFDAMRHQRSVPDLVIGFDCILRRLELQQRGTTSEMNEVLRQIPFIGFSTYGEQLDGMHINQTMTGVALWESTL